MRVAMKLGSELASQSRVITANCPTTVWYRIGVVSDWAKALKAVEVAEVALSEAVGEIHYWWGTSEGQTA